MGRHGATDTEPMNLTPKNSVWSEVWYLLMRVKKFIVALVGAAVTAAYTMPHEPPTRYNWQDYVPTVITFLTALGVLGTKNKEKKQ